MNITPEEVVDRQTVLEVQLEDEDLSPYLDRGYSRLVQRTAIPGFRKGKAPRAILERYLGKESLLNEAMDYMVTDVAERAIAEQELEAAGAPRIELLEIEPVKLKVTVALTPLVDLGVYKDIRLEDKPVEVGEADVDNRIQNMLKESAPWEPVERPVKLGDMVTMNVVGTVENSTILDKDDLVYVADEESLLPFPGFSKQLKGAKVSVSKEFELKIADDHTDARLAGKQARFDVMVSEVKEQKLPDLDDEFAKGAGEGYESVAALREAIGKEIDQEARSAQQAQFREATLEELSKLATVELPPLLVEHEVEHMVSRRDRFVDQLNIRKDDYLRFTGKTEDEIREEMRENAVERLTRSYALSTLAEQEGVDISSEEIDEEIQRLGASEDPEKGRIADQDMDSEQVRTGIRETLLVEKALERLTSIAKGEVPGPSGETPGANQDEQDEEEGGETLDAEA